MVASINGEFDKAVITDVHNGCAQNFKAGGYVQEHCTAVEVVHDYFSF